MILIQNILYFNGLNVPNKKIIWVVQESIFFLPKIHPIFECLYEKSLTVCTEKLLVSRTDLHCTCTVLVPYCSLN